MIRTELPAEIPLFKAILRNITGKQMESAAKASVEMKPAKKVSTKVYMVLKNMPTLAGTAIFRTRPGMGALVRSIRKRSLRMGASQDVFLGSPLSLPSWVLLGQKVFCVVTEPTVSVAPFVGDFSNGFFGNPVAAAEYRLVRHDFVESGPDGWSESIFNDHFVPSLGRPLCFLPNFSDSSELGVVEPANGSLD